MKPTNKTSFAAFWPKYVLLHLNPVNRYLHVAGTTLATVLTALAAIYEMYSIMPWFIGVGYGPAWLGHFVFERNKPASFKNPLFSIFADFWMVFKVFTFQWPREVAKAKRAT